MAGLSLGKYDHDLLTEFYYWNMPNRPTWKGFKDMLMLLEYCYMIGYQRELVGEFMNGRGKISSLRLLFHRPGVA